MKVVQNTFYNHKVRVKALYAECFDDTGRLETTIHMLEPAIQLDSGDSLTVTWTFKVG